MPISQAAVRFPNLLEYTKTPGLEGEVFATLLRRPGVHVEQIISHGQVTPEDEPWDQPHDEWVIVLTGGACLWFEGQGEIVLKPGDSVLIPAHLRHRVTWTDTDQPTIWLALHFETIAPR